MVTTVHRGLVTVLRRLNTITGEQRRNQYTKETQETNNALCSSYNEMIRAITKLKHYTCSVSFRKKLMQKIAELVLRHPERVKKQDSQKAKKQEQMQPTK
ncbi:unnamed protein product [Arabis nemorensis]|uniref:Uncharacterized protein n=1 Tax=Arabis nemorensis TaxID=586526 RepID=A0A565AQI0_9BRAS|nr:unnamed protein product [Arabis nemorensis]